MRERTLREISFHAFFQSCGDKSLSALTYHAVSSRYREPSFPFR
jgi:hypothetical protein